MLAYLSRRLIVAIASLFGVSIVLYTVLALAPGDVFTELTTNPAIPPDVIENLRQQFGMNDPIYLRYFKWLIAMLKGDWGYSFVSRADVGWLIMQRLPATLMVVGSAQILALFIALTVGTYAAVKPYSLFDQVANFRLCRKPHGNIDWGMRALPFQGVRRCSVADISIDQ